MNASIVDNNSNTTIWYKFRSASSFSALPLPVDATAIRLSDLKRAILQDRPQLQRAGLEFDLQIQNAATEEFYEDEEAIVPRETRVVVRRVAAERGCGLLARLAGSSGVSGSVALGPLPYEQGVLEDSALIVDYDQAQETVVVAEGVEAQLQLQVDESKELEALKAVTDQAGSIAYGSDRRQTPGGSAMTLPKLSTGSVSHHQGRYQHHSTGNEIDVRDHHSSRKLQYTQQLPQQQSQSQPSVTKKRATGIPRTFLSLESSTAAAAITNTGSNSATTSNAVSNTNNQSLKSNSNTAVDDTSLSTDNYYRDDDDDDKANKLMVGSDDMNGGTASTTSGKLASLLQPDTAAFRTLVQRAGGRSLSHDPSSAPNPSTHTIEYALKLTDMTLPNHLTCGICHSMVKNAMLVPWDSEGRPACESCIRDGIVKGGFVCPMTGVEGVSPEDLFVNVGLRKAVELFAEGVWEKVESMEKHMREEEEREEAERVNVGKRSNAKNSRGAGSNADSKTRVFEASGDRSNSLTANGSQYINIANDEMPHKNKKRGGLVDLYNGEDDEFGGDVFEVVLDEVTSHNATGVIVNNSAIAAAELSGASEVSMTETLEKGNLVLDSSTTVKKHNHNKMETNNEHNVGDDNDHHYPLKSMTIIPDITTIDGVEKQTALSKENNNEINNFLSTNNTCDKDKGSPLSGPSALAAPTAAAAVSRRKDGPPKRRGPPAGYMLGPAGGRGVTLTPKMILPPCVLTAPMFGLHNVPPPPPPRIGAPQVVVGVPPPLLPSNQGEKVAPESTTTRETCESELDVAICNSNRSSVVNDDLSGPSSKMVSTGPKNDIEAIAPTPSAASAGEIQSVNSNSMARSGRNGLPFSGRFHPHNFNASRGGGLGSFPARGRGRFNPHQQYQQQPVHYEGGFRDFGRGIGVGRGPFHGRAGPDRGNIMHHPQGNASAWGDAAINDWNFRKRPYHSVEGPPFVQEHQGWSAAGRGFPPHPGGRDGRLESRGGMGYPGGRDDGGRGRMHFPRGGGRGYSRGRY